MKFDNFGNTLYQEPDLIDLIYQNKIDFIDTVLVEETEAISQFIKNSGLDLNLYREINSDLETFDSICQSVWFVPDEYKTLDIDQLVLEMCSSIEEQARCIEELSEFNARGMSNLLKWLKYVVDTCRANNIIWGVGRGSSVASYVLYLLGVHKINSIKYNLDWREFLR